MNGLNGLKASWRTLLAAAVVFLAGVNASSAIVRGASPTRGAALLSAAITAVTTIAVTALIARYSRFPRWAFYASAFVLGVGAMALAALHPDLASWKHESTSAWMTPWFPFVVAIVSPRYEARGACGVDDPRMGWVFVAISLVLATVPPIISVW
jgi:hypothetical protein